MALCEIALGGVYQRDRYAPPNILFIPINFRRTDVLCMCVTGFFLWPPSKCIACVCANHIVTTGHLQNTHTRALIERSESVAFR